MSRPDCGCGPRVPRRKFLHMGTGAALGVALLGVAARRASAHPVTPDFGRLIDPYPDYDGQSTCDPTAKPGVLDFRTMVLASWAGTADWGIVRECSAGGQSEHKEGRAWDWGVPDASDRTAVEDLLRWLFATDRWGNRHARARRLGIMYVIHDKKIWRAYPPGPGFFPRDCNPNASFDDCHFDHVHFSMSWDGALRRTTWWHPGSTFDRAAELGTTHEAAGGQPPVREDC